MTHKGWARVMIKIREVRNDMQTCANETSEWNAQKCTCEEKEKHQSCEKSTHEFKVSALNSKWLRKGALSRKFIRIFAWKQTAFWNGHKGPFLSRNGFLMKALWRAPPFNRMLTREETLNVCERGRKTWKHCVRAQMYKRKSAIFLVQCPILIFFPPADGRNVSFCLKMKIFHILKLRSLEVVK